MRHHDWVLIQAVVFTLGCGAGDPAPAAGSGGTSAVAGASGSGGKGAAGGGAGGAAGGTGGSSGSAGASAGSGGVSSGAGGQSGSSGSGGSSGGSTAATPSLGCGKGGRPNGGELTVSGEHIYTFPETYDGTTPMPLVFGFPGANRTDSDFRNNDAPTVGTDFEKKYVMAYMKSIGNNWTDQLDANFGRFDSAYDELTNNYCIDTSRVFGMGHSSGAQFCSRLVCRPEQRLRAVAPVASSPTDGDCRAIPTLIIHGKNDTVRGNDGAEYVAEDVMRNGCESQSMPYDVATCTSREGGLVTPGCVAYQGCGDNPTIWCSHDDPFYGGTNHGWPCFANQAILDFFASLP